MATTTQTPTSSSDSNTHTQLQVSGMDCANCAQAISRVLHKQGIEEVSVNFVTGEVRYRTPVGLPASEVYTAIESLGYRVVSPASGQTSAQRRSRRSSWLPDWSLEQRLIVSSIFTAPFILLHLPMLAGVHFPLWEHNGWLQLLLCLPVYGLGMAYLGRSAWSSLRAGVPNMDVLIAIGSTAAFFYSVVGTALQRPDYLFYETAASIITLVLLGNWIEKRAVQRTHSAIDALQNLQPPTATLVLTDSIGKETSFTVQVADLRPGDCVRINTGDAVPADGIVVSGTAAADESMLTGESLPVEKEAGSPVTGGTILRRGNLVVRVTATGADTALSRIVELVKSATQQKPTLQRLADRIAAVFVPVVVGIAALTLLVSWWVLGVAPGQALMNAIAVLVISCPCAMGLATPTAVTVGIGRMAQQGILVRGAQTLEQLASVRHLVFDKTGTLTEGRIEVSDLWVNPAHPEALTLLRSLEERSSHPLARAIVAHLQSTAQALPESHWQHHTETPGLGITATDIAGRSYTVGPARLALPHTTADIALWLGTPDRITAVLATATFTDTLRPDAATTLNTLHRQGYTTTLLSGDTPRKVAAIAQQLGIQHYLAAQTPTQKLEQLSHLSNLQPTAMIGDGINDAPALARATVGISLGDASAVAIQSAQVLLLGNRLSALPQALRISHHTLLTIRQSLLWAFAYNIVAIPLAATGHLSPMWGALFMAFSDLVVIGNALRLRYKTIT